MTAVVAGWTWLSDMRHSPVQVVERLHGKTLDAVLAELGKPANTHEFTMPVEGTLPEFRIELHNTYPPNRPENANVVIKELHWEELRYNIAVWFHRVGDAWVVLDTCRWRKDVRF